MTTAEPIRRTLRLPTPGCNADAERSGLMADDVFDGMTEHLFYLSLIHISEPTRPY